MLELLIDEGEKLEAEAKEGMVGKILSGVNFESWASKVILYLEENYPSSTITERAQSIYKKLGTNSYNNYEFLLGALKAIQSNEE